MINIHISEGDHTIYYFSEDLIPGEKNHEVSTFFLDKVKKAEKEFFYHQRILKTLYEEMESKK